MTFNISPRESLVRCDSYSNKFQSFNSEIETKMKAARIHAAFDVQESESARLERMMMQKFTKGFFRQEGNNYEFIKKVGKFVFVAVLMPPYFVVYLAPKLVLQYGLPFVANIGETSFSRLLTMFNSAANWVAHVSGLLAEQFNKLFRFRLFFPFGVLKSSKDMIQRGFERVMNLLRPPLQKMKDALDKQKKKLNDLWKKALERMKKGMSKHLPRLISLLIPRLPKVSLKLPKLPSLPKITLPPIKNIVLAILKELKQLARLKEIPLALGTFFWDILKLNYQNWVEPYFQWVIPLGRSSFQKCLHFSQKCQKMRSATKVLTLKIASWTRQKIEELRSKAHDKLTTLATYLHHKLKLLQNRVVPILQALDAKLNLALHWLQEQGEKGKSILSTTSKGLKKLPHNSLHLIQSLIATLTSFLLELLQALRLAFIVTKVLFRLGFQYLRSLH